MTILRPPLICLLSCLLLLAIPQPAYACSCVSTGLSESEQLLSDLAQDYNKYAFVGTVTRKTQGLSSKPFTGEFTKIYVTFTVDRVYKGRVGEQFTLTTSVQESACGYRFQAGHTYLVFAGNDLAGGVINSSLCNGNVAEPTTSQLAVLGESYSAESFGSLGSNRLEVYMRPIFLGLAIAATIRYFTRRAENFG